MTNIYLEKIAEWEKEAGVSREAVNKLQKAIAKSDNPYLKKSLTNIEKKYGKRKSLKGVQNPNYTSAS